jgi:hypothetical protein
MVVQLVGAVIFYSSFCEHNVRELFDCVVVYVFYVFFIFVIFILRGSF